MRPELTATFEIGPETMRSSAITDVLRLWDEEEEVTKEYSLAQIQSVESGRFEELADEDVLSDRTPSVEYELAEDDVDVTIEEAT